MTDVIDSLCLLGEPPWNRTFGEGCHGFHYRFASDERNGVRWDQWDPGKWVSALYCLSVGEITTTLIREANQGGAGSVWLERGVFVRLRKVAIATIPTLISSFRTMPSLSVASPAAFALASGSSGVRLIADYFKAAERAYAGALPGFHLIEQPIAGF